MDKVMDMLSQLGAKLAELSAHYGPQLVEVVGRLYQLHAIGNLLTVPILGGLTWIGWYVTRVCLCQYAKAKHTPGMDDDAWLFAVIGAISVSMVLTAATVVLTLAYVADPVVWASAFDPNIAIAAHVLDAIRSAAR